MNWIPINSPYGLQKYALIDDEDYELVHRYRWGVRTHRRKEGCWAYPFAYDPKTLDGHYLHRLVMRATKGQVVDHINGNPFDSRKQNLRLCTTAENSRNRPKYKAETTNNYKGVFKTKSGKKYMALLRINREHFKFGPFENEVFAALVYDMAALHYHGRFANTNFTDEQRRFLLCLVNFYDSPEFESLSGNFVVPKKNFATQCNSYTLNERVTG